MRLEIYVWNSADNSADILSRAGVKWFRLKDSNTFNASSLKHEARTFFIESAIYERTSDTFHLKTGEAALVLLWRFVVEAALWSCWFNMISQ